MVIVKATPRAGRNHGTYVLLTDNNIGRILQWVLLAHAGGIDDNNIDEAGDDVDEPTVKVDLEVQLFQCDGEVSGKLIYDAALYDVATVRLALAVFAATRPPSAKQS